MSGASDLRSRVDGLMLSDQQAFRRRLSGLHKIEARSKRDRILTTITTDLGAAEARVRTRRGAVPSSISYPEDLPITGRRDELAETIKEHQVVIVAGETGSGKSTQLPKICLESGRGVLGFIGHTQPRRIAARSIAERIAEELAVDVGGPVGFAMRFTDQVSDETLIKVMTDGILLAEIHSDPELLRYDTIIIDEAHERSLNIDFLLGYLVQLLPRRPDLKLIVTSATIDTDRFASHFGDAPVVEVSGRTYPVEVRYRPLDDPTLNEPRDQPQGICDAVLELIDESAGDILVFCSGEREIRDAADALTELELKHTEILPLYGRLSAAEQHRVFERHTGRRIVLATNVAETSITVPGVRAIVDPGTARISRAGRTGVQRLPIEPISKASADQRAGRCGRVGPGVGIRLYSQEDFEARPEFTEPEIQRTNLSSVLLRMAALDLGDIESFPFLDPPDRRSIRQGILLLEELGAVDPHRYGSKRWLTERGQRMAQMPVDPRLARMVLAADENAALREVLVIVAALSIQDPRERPTDKEQQALEKHRRFHVPGSDLLGWLRLWEYLGEERRARSSSRFAKMCREEFLNYRRVREWQDVHGQLRQLADELRLSLNQRPADDDAVHRSILTGLLSQVGVRDPESFEYRGTRGTRFAINPGSVLFKASPPWVMAGDLVETTRLWAREVAAIDPAWVEQIGSHLVSRTHSEPWWSPERGTAVARESVTMLGLPLSADRTVPYGRIDPATSRRMFIHHALVLGEWSADHEFVERNRAALEDVEALQARLRRFDLLRSDDEIASFFEGRLPEEVVSSRHFDRWWRDERSARPHLLDLSRVDLIDPSVGDVNDDAFPEVWRHGDVEMPIRYEFDPTSTHDGITVEIPVDRLDRVDPGVFEWHVPGLRAELVESLVRSLPKATRKHFIPIGETVREIVDGLEPGPEGLLASLRRELTRRSGTPIAPDAFDLDRLPAHLRPAFRVIDVEGETVAEGDDLAHLKEELHETIRTAMSGATHPVEQSGLTDWTIGQLPRRVSVGLGDNAVVAYPALVDEGDSVAVRLMATPSEQRESMWMGTRRLILLRLPSPGKLLRPLITERAKAALAVGPYESTTEWAADCMAAAIDEIVESAGGPAWDGVGFDRLVAEAKDSLHTTTMSVADAAIDALEALWAAGVAAEELPQGPRFERAIADVKAQIDQIVFPGFIAAAGAERLPDIGRYLRAVERRLDGLPSNPQRDDERMAQVQEIEDEHRRLVEAIGPTPELVEVAWMLQELRVSLFAQQLGTKGTVSAKRIRRALAEAIA